MTRHRIWMLSLLIAAGCILVHPRQVRADRIDFNDGTSLEGIIQKVENGTVTMEVSQGTREFSVLDITRMEFDSPHFQPESSRFPPEHFLAAMGAQEMLTHIREVETAAADARSIMNKTKRSGKEERPSPPTMFRHGRQPRSAFAGRCPDIRKSWEISIST